MNAYQDRQSSIIPQGQSVNEPAGIARPGSGLFVF
jgi:hypothetical protein